MTDMPPPARLLVRLRNLPDDSLDDLAQGLRFMTEKSGDESWRPVFAAILDLAVDEQARRLVRGAEAVANDEELHDQFWVLDEPEPGSDGRQPGPGPDDAA